MSEGEVFVYNMEGCVWVRMKSVGTLCRGYVWVRMKSVYIT